MASNEKIPVLIHGKHLSSLFLFKIPLVSHLKERKEKICLNCNADLYGRYCHVCGQENLEPKETVWHLVTHFFNDITHFDGKFFETVKYLLRKPGFLSTQYMAGKRASYLNPIRMYVFTSAIFFIIVFSFRGGDNMVEEKDNLQGLKELQHEKTRLEKKLDKVDKEDKPDVERRITQKNREMAAFIHVYGADTARKLTDEQIEKALEQDRRDSLLLPGISQDTRVRLGKELAPDQTNRTEFSLFGLMPDRYHSVTEYDSVQAHKPEELKDAWMIRVIQRKLIAVRVKYHGDTKAIKEHFKENFIHSFPKIMFVSLPIFALILNILYFRHKKQYYYVNHGIFTIHVYCATFILLMLFVLIQQLANVVDVAWVDVLCGVINFAIWLYILIYLYKAMRGFYKQRRFKTFVKYFITCCIAFVVNMILLLIFVLISAINL